MSTTLSQVKIKLCCTHLVAIDLILVVRVLVASVIRVLVQEVRVDQVDLG